MPPTPRAIEAVTLAEILEEIRQIEESEGFEGPKISDIERYIYGLEYRAEGQLPPEWREDIVVGEIGRACDARRWQIKIEGPYDGPGEDNYFGEVITLIGQHSYKSEDAWATTYAEALASAYRDALKESMQ